MKNRIRELRKQRGITQKHMAAGVKVSRQTIGAVENGRCIPSIKLAYKLARYFGVSINEVYSYIE